MTELKPNTKLRAVGFPQRLNNLEKRENGEAQTPHAEPGEIFQAKDHCSPEWALKHGFAEIVDDEKAQDKGGK